MRGEVSKIAPAYPECWRPLFSEDYHEQASSYNEAPRWPLRLLFSILARFIMVGSFLLVIIEALLGFGLVVAGLVAFPVHAVLGGTSIACGVGIFLWMIVKGLNAAFGGR